MEYKFHISVLEYLGKIENGILVLLSIVYNNEYYEATYFYTDEQLVLTVPEELEEVLGHKIIDDPNYVDIIKAIIKKVVPYSEMWGRLDEVDFSRWVEMLPEEDEKAEGDSSA
jgi:hypothetical protein